MEFSFCFHSSCNEVIAMKFCMKFLNGEMGHWSGMTMFLVLLPQRLLLLTSNPFVFTLGIWYKQSVGLGKCTG